jgi:hypothetical protein
VKIGVFFAANCVLKHYLEETELQRVKPANHLSMFKIDY